MPQSAINSSVGENMDHIVIALTEDSAYQSKFKGWVVKESAASGRKGILKNDELAVSMPCRQHWSQFVEKAY